MASRDNTHSITEEIEKTPETEPEVNAPVQKKNITWSRIKRKIFKHVIILRILLLSVLVLVLFGIFAEAKKISKKYELPFYAGLARDFLTAPVSKVDTTEGRTNILVLGKGGKGHEAPDLTDSIMFVSVKHQTSDIVLISLPRDVWIPELRAKINSAYYWGNKKADKGGLPLAKSTVEEVIGQPIHYAVVIDFSGFKDIIDTLGGIDVDVEKEFTDNRYPIAGRENDMCSGDKNLNCRYESVSFKKGVMHMDGETALKYVRSRYSEGDEGTDLARAARQQKVIQAMKKKALSREILLSPGKLFALKDAVLKTIETDMTPSEAAVVGRRFVGKDTVTRNYVLGEELLDVVTKDPKYDNQYVFVPKAKDDKTSFGRSWNSIHDWVKCLLDNNCK